MLSKVISGGQTGADMGGLEAARRSGLETGGWMPEGFRTEEGYHPEYADIYGLREIPGGDYRARTIRNVEDSDGTIVISPNANSSGTRLTLKTAKARNKPLFPAFLVMADDLQIARIAEWIRASAVQTLNVAGNRESVTPGLHEFVEELLVQVFAIVKEDQNRTESTEFSSQLRKSPIANWPIENQGTSG